MVEQIEKRIPFRRIMKQTLSKIISSKQVKGAKILLGGRLDGAEIARAEHMEQGSMPLQTLTADIDFAKAELYLKFKSDSPDKKFAEWALTQMVNADPSIGKLYHEQNVAEKEAKELTNIFFLLRDAHVTFRSISKKE